MQINVAARGVAVPRRVRQIAERRLSKLERLLHRIETADITCSREREWWRVEIVLNANGVLVRGEDRALDMQSALEGLLDKLERRVKKSRSKLIQRYRHQPETQEAWEAEPEEEGEEDLRPRLVRSKRFAIKPMGPEEAAAQMELLGHDFYVFQNAETEQVNVVYRRKDGHYGLIEPEF